MVLQTIVVFLPALLALIVIFRKSLEQAVLSVYLPVLLCVPLYDNVKLPFLPALDPASTTSLAIGIWLLATKMRNLRFTRTDLWIALYGISCGVSPFEREPSATYGFFALFGFFTTYLIPYLIGKLLIEQEKLREVFAKRFVFLMAAVGVISLYEYRMGVNPFHYVWVKIFPAPVGFVAQFRWGLTRSSGPLRSSEETGMLFLVAVLLAYWLYTNKIWERKFRFMGHPYTKGALIFAGVCIGMLTCQARGPYLGVVLGLIIARIGNGKNLKRRAVYTLIILVIGGSAVYSYGKKYAAADAQVQSGDQQNAVYRSQMLQNYWPVVQEGGLFGWAYTWPVQHRQKSIDNAFLLSALEQGYLGAGSFMLLFLDSLLMISFAVTKMKQQKDVAFVFCLGGCILGEILCMGTVATDPPVTQIIILLVGWSQSIRAAEPVAERAKPVLETQRYSFRRVFT